MSELIIYLEPSDPLQTCVNQFIKDITSELTVNTAIKYHAHVTMTGFFTLTEEDDLLKIRDQLGLIIQEYHTRLKAETPKVHHPMLIKEPDTDDPKHVILPVTVSSDYITIMKLLSQHYTSLRIKKINHISLAYWDEPNSTSTEDDQWILHCHLLKGIQYSDRYFRNAIKDTKSWDIVLYRRIHKGIHVNEPHQFEEVARWPIYYD